MTIGQKTRKQRVLDPGPEGCHPRIHSRNGSCLSESVVKNIGESLGAPRTLKRRSLRKWIKTRTQCKTERCLVEKTPMDGGKKDKLLNEFFRPKMPEGWKRDPDEWLDSLNIQDVIRQYEEIYPNFKFYGANPIDFAAPDPQGNIENPRCLQEDMCSIQLNQLKDQGKTHLGFVYNLDPHTKGGSHWIASFTDIPGHKSYYFDSYGMKPPPQIARFLRSLTLQDPSMKLFYNARRFQFGGSECGMYCLYFLIRMLEGDDFRAFCRRAPKDKEMLKLRKWLFSS